jgi:hypothetical protein
MTMSLELISQSASVTHMLDRVSRKIDELGIEEYLGFKVHPWLVGRVKARFEAGGDSASGKWRPLTDATFDWRRSYGWADGPINVRSGDMLQFLTRQATAEIVPDPGGAILAFPGNSGLTPELADKIRVAQKGGQAPPPSGPTPARPVLALGAEDYIFFVRSIHEHVVGI